MASLRLQSKIKQTALCHIARYINPQEDEVLGDVFNPFRFAIQSILGGSIIKYETEIKNLHSIRLLDLCAGTGFLGIYLYNSLKNIRKVVATEVNPFAIEFLKKNILRSNAKRAFKVLKTVGNRRIYPEKETNKYEVIISNPPYVPFPNYEFGHVWSNGGFYGIDFLEEIYRKLNRFTKKGSILFIFSYSLGKRKPEDGSLIIENFHSDGIQMKEHLILTEKLKKEWNFKYYVLNPPAWVGFIESNREGIADAIKIKDYYDLLGYKNNQKLLKYSKELKENKIGYLHNVIICAERAKPKKESYLIKSIDVSYMKKVMKLERLCWPIELQATERNLKSRLVNFNIGCHAAFDLKGQMIGFSTSQIIKFDTNLSEGRFNEIKPVKWMELDTNRDANLKKTQNLNGNALHLVSACVLPKNRRNGIWKSMIIYRLSLAKIFDLDYVVIMTRFAEAKFSNEKGMLGYLNKMTDPNVSTLAKLGFRPIKYIKKEDDKNSGFYWIMMLKELKND